MMQRQARMRGFTLVELLVSVLIISLGLIALSQLYMAAMWSYQKGRNMSLATQRAQLELEKVQNLGFAPLHNYGPTITDGFMPKTLGGEYTTLTNLTGRQRGVSYKVPTLPNGQGTTIWEPYPDPTVSAADEHLLKVTVHITWNGPPMGQANVTVPTLISEL